jgi:hypothetical protein
VVKDNTLLRKAQTDLTRNERKLINYLISLIKPDDEYFKEFYIKISEFAALIGTESTHIYREFREMADDLENKSFWYKFPNGEVGKIHWVMKPKYHEKKGYMKLRLLRFQNTLSCTPPPGRTECERSAATSAASSFVDSSFAAHSLHHIKQVRTAQNAIPPSNMFFTLIGQSSLI